MPQCVLISAFVCMGGRGGVVTDQVVKWVCGAAAPTGAPRLFTVHPYRQPKVFIATIRQPTRYILN